MSSGLHKRVLQSGIGGLPPRGLMPPPTASGRGRGRGRGGGRTRDYSAVPWDTYFESREAIEVGAGSKFMVYSRASADASADAPVLLLLHGGGFSALTWSLFAADVTSRVLCRVIAVDLRGHGDTKTADDRNLSAHTLADDVAAVAGKVVPPTANVVLVGHSMGGALAVHAAMLGTMRGLVGICVIDVVEGTAMDALAGMQSVLRNRPSRFKSLDFAIEWCVRSGQVRNVDSARVSMPGQLKNASTGKCATADVGAPTAKATAVERLPTVTLADSIAEEAEDGGDGQNPQAAVESTPQPTALSGGGDAATAYTWRIDLMETEKHWPGWFQGLTDKFLSVPAAKLLVLAGVDRLDRDLTIGQMQGKFQMQVLPQAGHAVHEDVPDRVADVLATFMVRNKFATPLDDYQRTFPAC